MATGISKCMQFWTNISFWTNKIENKKTFKYF